MVASAGTTIGQRMRPAGPLLRLVCGLLALAPLAAADAEEPLILPAGFAGLNLSLDQISGKVNNYLGYEGFSYVGRDILTGGNGQMTFTYGRNTPLLDQTSQSPTLTSPEDYADAWSLKLATDPKQTKGLRYSVNLTDVDADFEGAKQFKFGPEMAGVRQADFQAGWSAGSLALDIGRERLADKATGLGLGRQNLTASAFGFTYTRDRLNVDQDAVFSSALNKRLLGKDGYNLSARKLGSARAGYTDLTALGGLSDAYEGMSFAQGDFAVGFSERELTQGGARLVDRERRAALGPLAVSQTTRILDAGFTNYAEAGYADWRSLVGGREDSTEATLKTKLLQGNYQQTRLYSNPRQLEGKGSITETMGYRLALSPAKWVGLSYQHNESKSGAESLWEDSQDKLVRTSQDRYNIGLTFDAHKLTLGLRDYATTRPTTRLDGHEYTVAYGHGKRTKLTYQERAETLATTAKDETTIAVSHMQVMSVETAFGLSALHERTTRQDSDPEQHDVVRFDRSFGPRYDVKMGFESWEQSADKTYEVGGYRNILAKPVSDAEAFDVAVTVRPGTAELSAWHRSLLWTQDSKAGGWSAGGHRLTETGVSVQQAITGDFGLKGTWTRFDRDHDMDLDRREVALVIKPDAKNKNSLLPTAEIGYRELRNAEGEVRPSLYASASMKPYEQLQLEAKLRQQQQDVGAKAVVDGWDTVDRQALQLSATHKIGKDGSAKVVYADTPLAPRGRLAEDDPLLRSQDITVGFSTPSNWILPGLRLTGKYHTRNTPAYGDGRDRSLTEHEAGLVWANGEISNLTATYTLSKDLLGSYTRGQSRFEFEFSQRIDDGKLAVTGYVHDVFDLDLRRRDDERYRFGLNYTVPF